jgi:2-C-methyl-D-erythritol 4-phosphate cytidylyltransferase
MIWAVVPAAGSGRRFAAAQPKQYARIDGRSVLEWTLARLAEVSRLSGLMVVVAADDRCWPGLNQINGKIIATTTGGAERAASVLAGLRALPDSVKPADFVLVHDAARPCVRVADIDQLIDQAPVRGGGLLAAPVRDTLKRQDDAMPIRVAHTVARAGLWRALTPQMFRRGELTAALIAAQERGLAATDEAQAMEAVGAQPALIEGAEDNIKITTGHDLALAQFLLRAQETA